MLIISPKTHSKTVKQFVEFFKAEPKDTAFWHSNFRDYHFQAKISDIPVHLLFCGYGEGTMNHAITHAYKNFLHNEDTHPFIIYVGACFATTVDGIEVGDIVIASGAHSDSEIVKEMRQKSGNQSEDFDSDLVQKMKDVGSELGIKTISGKIFCKETYEREFWFPFATDWGPKQGYLAGEVESAAFLAACQVIGIPCMAVLEVKDKLSVSEDYKVAADIDRGKVFADILKLLEGVVKKVG